jgi:hypothetical protein
MYEEGVGFYRVFAHPGAKLIDVACERVPMIIGSDSFLISHPGELPDRNQRRTHLARMCFRGGWLCCVLMADLCLAD